MLSLQEHAGHQPHAVETIQRAMVQNRLHHAYLIVAQQLGDATSFAEAITGALVCQCLADPPSGCTQCAGCRKARGGNHPDVAVLTPNDKGRITVDGVRTLNQRLHLRSLEASRHVVIIHEACAMNTQAQNALLKTLEEPPGPTCFILTTSRYRAMLPTVRSRCLRIGLLGHTDAATVLCEAGIDARFSEPLAMLVGHDVVAAQRLIEQDFEGVAKALRGLLSNHPTPAGIIRVAADLGGSAERAEIAWALLTLEVRYRLAKGCSTTAATTADRLLRHHMLQPYHMNRILGLENALFGLCGYID